MQIQFEIPRHIAIQLAEDPLQYRVFGPTSTHTHAGRIYSETGETLLNVDFGSDQDNDRVMLALMNIVQKTQQVVFSGRWDGQPIKVHIDTVKVISIADAITIAEME